MFPRSCQKDPVHPVAKGETDSNHDVNEPRKLLTQLEKTTADLRLKAHKLFGSVTAQLLAPVVLVVITCACLLGLAHKDQWTQDESFPLQLQLAQALFVDRIGSVQATAEKGVGNRTSHTTFPGPPVSSFSGEKLREALAATANNTLAPTTIQAASKRLPTFRKGENTFSPLMESFESKLDRLETEQCRGVSFSTPSPVHLPDHVGPLRVYVYNLPLELNWEMLIGPRRPNLPVFGPGLFKSDSFPSRADPRWCWSGCPGNYSAQVPVYHSNPSAQQAASEYYLLLSIIQGLPSIKRVENPEDAQLFFPPFFTSLSFNWNMTEPDIHIQKQRRFMKWLKDQKYWKRSRGLDHLVAAHHPNAVSSIMKSLETTRLMVADFSRNESMGSNYEKDLVSPYKAFVEPGKSSIGWHERKTLLFFLGGLRRKKGGYIRMKLKEVLKGEKGVKMLEGKPSNDGISVESQGMQSSRFCLTPAGDTPSSCRLFDSILSLCVPVVVSQAIELPYEDVLDYTEFAVFVPTYKALTPGHLAGVLRNITREQWEAMHKRLREVRPHFQFSHPAVPGGAEDMLWRAVARKVLGKKEMPYREKRLKLQERSLDPASRYIW